MPSRAPRRSWSSWATPYCCCRRDFLQKLFYLYFRNDYPGLAPTPPGCSRICKAVAPPAPFCNRTHFHDLVQSFLLTFRLVHLTFTLYAFNVLVENREPQQGRPRRTSSARSGPLRWLGWGEQDASWRELLKFCAARGAFRGAGAEHMASILYGGGESGGEDGGDGSAGGGGGMNQLFGATGASLAGPRGRSRAQWCLRCSRAQHHFGLLLSRPGRRGWTVTLAPRRLKVHRRVFSR